MTNIQMPHSRWLLAVLWWLTSRCGNGLPDGYQPEVGDVLFQSLPSSPLTEVIEGATGSPYSHCGLVVEEAGRLEVLEAFHTVKGTSLAEFVRRGRGGALAVYRFREPWAAEVPRIVAAAKRMRGRPYDHHYSMDDDAIYCSELIFKAFREVAGVDLGRTRELRELNWRPFERFLREQEGGSLPLDRRIITPRALSEAGPLEELLRSGW